MHLVAREPQRVTIPGIGAVQFARGETLRTEISAKYDEASVAELFQAAGLRLEAWRSDADRLFGLAVGSPA
jgi:L-histidine N-alpha-methyltransferase